MDSFIEQYENSEGQNVQQNVPENNTEDRANIESKHQKAYTEGLESNHGNAMEGLESNHKKAMKGLKNTHKERMEGLENSHKERMGVLVHEHEKAVELLENKQREAVVELEQRLAALIDKDEVIASLQARIGHLERCKRTANKR